MRMNLIRHFGAFLAVACCVVVLAGCHGSRDTTAFEIPETWDASKDYELTFWAKNDTNKAQTKIYEKAIRDFEKLYPNVHVSMKLYTDYGKIYSDVITNIATKTTPNVCITYPDHIATYLTGNNVVVPLDGLMASERYGLGGSELAFDAPTQDEVVPEFLRECVLDGAHYALPFMRSTEVCYVNKTFVEKLGYELPDVLTWDFVWEVSEAATAKKADGTYAVNGQQVMIPFIYKSTDNMMIHMLRQLDGGFSTQMGGIDVLGAANENAREVLKTIAAHAKTGAFSTFQISGYPGNFFNEGQCIFAVDSSAGSTWIGPDAPLVDIPADKKVHFETAVRMVPQYDAANPAMISQGPSVCIFNKEDPDEVMASWLFVQYLLTNDVQSAYAQTEGYVPVTTKAQESKEFKAYLAASGTDAENHYQVKIDATKTLMSNAQYSFTTPVFNGSTSLRDAAGQLIENTTKSARNKEVIDDDYLDALFVDVAALYHLDQLGTDAPSADKASLGPLPRASVILIACLAVAWVGIGGVALHDKLRQRDARVR